MNKPTGTSARRVLRVLDILKGRTLSGLTNGEIATALHETPVNITRALAVLDDEGCVRKLETGRWAHSIKIAKWGYAHVAELDKAEKRIAEIRQRTTAGAMI